VRSLRHYLYCWITSNLARPFATLFTKGVENSLTSFQNHRLLYLMSLQALPKAHNKLKSILFEQNLLLYTHVNCTRSLRGF